METCDVLIIAPFRRPVFRTAISRLYPFNEPWDSPPLLIAGAVEDAGLEVKYLPLINLLNGFDEQQDMGLLEKVLNEHPARLVIFSADHFIPSRSTASIYGIRIISKKLNEKPDPPLIGLTGRLATVVKEKMFDLVPELDFVIVGEPELIIGDIVSTILYHGIDHAENNYKCLISKSNLGYMSKEIIPAVVEDLDAMSLPAYHLLKSSFEIYEKMTGHVCEQIPFSIRTSLGCKFKCKFCSGVPNWLNYRKKSRTRIEKELESFDKHVGGIGRIAFLEDEIFTRDVEHVRNMTEVFKKKKIFLDGLYTHSTLLTPDIAHMLQQVTNKVYLGLDNADDNILKKMGKGQKLDTVLKAIEIAKKAHLKVHLEWIIGTPEETVDSLITSLGAIFNLLMTGAVEDINSYVYCPHPGTEYAENHTKYDLYIIEDFEGMQESGGYPAFETPYLSRNQVFAAYLMSQLVIAETKLAREMYGPKSKVRPPNREELKQLFEKIGKESSLFKSIEGMRG